MNTRSRFQIPDAPGPFPEANRGISLSIDCSTIVVTPNATAASYHSFALPRIYGSLLERLGGACRCFYRRYHRSLTFLLYLDLIERSWIGLCPPQFAAPNASRWNSSFAGTTPPSPQLRLAGSFQSLRMDDPQLLYASMPPWDGVHLAVHPEHDWLSISAFLCLGGSHSSACLDHLILDDYDHLLDDLSGQIWLADRL